jgi:hypothetical protein
MGIGQAFHRCPPHLPDEAGKNCEDLGKNLGEFPVKNLAVSIFWLRGGQTFKELMCEEPKKEDSKRLFLLQLKSADSLLVQAVDFLRSPHTADRHATEVEVEI